MPRLVPFRTPRCRLGGRDGTAPRVELDLDAAWGLYDRQARFVGSDHLFGLFLGGVGSGKSHALTRWIVRRALANPGEIGALLGRTSIDLQTVLLPSLWEALDQCQEQSGISLIKGYDKGDGRLTLINDCQIYFRPFNRIAKVRGLTLTFAGADEVEWSEADPDEVWGVFTGRLRGHGPLPGLAFATSPNGLRGITKRFVEAQRAYLDAREAGDAEAASKWGRYHVVSSTSFHNPYLPGHYFDALKSMSKRRYRQEVEGKVLRPTNSVWALEARHLVRWDWRQHEHLPRLYAVDWGTQDHHVGLMIQVERDGRWVVADELICDDMPRGRFQAVLHDWIDSHGRAPPTLMAADRAVPVENNKLQVRYSDTPVRWMESKQDQAVRTGVEHVRDMLDPVGDRPLLVFAQSLAQQIKGETAPIVPALRGYCYVRGADGQPTDKPRKDNVHDHACDALRYIVTAGAHDPTLHGGRTMWSSAREQIDAGQHGHGRSDRHA